MTENKKTIDFSGLKLNVPEKFSEVANTILQGIDKGIAEPGSEECTYDSAFNRSHIEHAFNLLKDIVKQAKGIDVTGTPLEGILSEADRLLSERQALDSLTNAQDRLLSWYDKESPLARLEDYFEVFTVRKSSRRSIRGLAVAFMRFNNWQPQFTEEEAWRFLRVRAGANSASRKIYGAFLRTFFRAQNIRQDDLPFSHKRLKVADEDKPKRKTYPFEVIVHFINQCKESNSPKAKFYGSLVTTYGFRPIEMGRITDQNIDREHHEISLQTAKRGNIRTHHIPEAIRPYVYNYHPEPIPDNQMHALWRSVCRHIKFRPQNMEQRADNKQETEGTGYGYYKGCSWYGIRHALFTNLVQKAEIHPMKLDKWGGWRTGQASGAGMVGIYHAPGLTEMKEIDMEVLAKHPFLGYWDNTGNYVV